MIFGNIIIQNYKNFNNKGPVNFLKMIPKAMINCKTFFKIRRFKKKTSNRIQIINRVCIN